MTPKCPLDLHVLSLPPAFVLSQDQTLKFIQAITTLTHKLLSPQVVSNPGLLGAYLSRYDNYASPNAIMHPNQPSPTLLFQIIKLSISINHTKAATHIKRSHAIVWYLRKQHGPPCRVAGVLSWKAKGDIQSEHRHINHHQIRRCRRGRGRIGPLAIPVKRDKSVLCLIHQRF